MLLFIDYDFYFFLQVNLYSDGPKPGHSVQSVYNQEASKFMTLDFPQAQRAEASLISLTSDEQRIPQSIFILLSIYHYISTRLIMIFVFWSDPPVTKEPSVTLYTQASDFLQRVKSTVDNRLWRECSRRFNFSHFIFSCRSLRIFLSASNSALTNKER